MRGEELIDLFEDLDDELIEEAATATLLPTYQKRRTLLVACACALLVLSAPAFFLFSGLFKGSVTTDDLPSALPSDGAMASKIPEVPSLRPGISAGASLPPPEESNAPWSEPSNDPFEGSDTFLLALHMSSSFKIHVENGVVTQVTAPDSESGEAILAELRAEGKDPTGGTLENALVWLFEQMLERGEHQENDTVTLALLSYEDGLSTPEAQKALLDEGADILSRLAESKDAVIRITTEGAVD